MVKRVLLLCATLGALPAIARPWNGIEPGVTQRAEVVKKFGDPVKVVNSGGKEILAYLAPNAIHGTTQAQFRVDPPTQRVERIDVFPGPTIDKETIESTYGTACPAGNSGQGNCYIKKLTEDFKTYFVYGRMGLTIFFNEDGKTVQSFVFLPAKAKPAAPSPPATRRSDVHIIGLTGGIASGKSTVSAMLRDLGATILDADVLAREVVEPGTPGLAEVAARFPECLKPDGTVDRVKLGAHVFQDAEARTALNAILHPRIQQAFVERTVSASEQGVGTLVYDAALLMENGLDSLMNATVVVLAGRERQRDRLVTRNKLNAQEAEARIDVQLSDGERKRRATWVVDNSGTLEHTRKQVEAIWRAIQLLR